jgi:hypothetical protein
MSFETVSIATTTARRTGKVNLAAEEQDVLGFELLNRILFCNMTPSSPLKSTDVSEQYSTAIFKV